MIVILTVMAMLSLSLGYMYLKGLETGEKASFGGEIMEGGRRSLASIKGVSIRESIDNKTSLEIKAGKADVRNKKMGFFRVALQKVTEMEDVTVSIYEDGVEVISISSGTAILDLGTKDVLFEGQVKCISKTNKRLESGKLFLNSKKNIISTEGDYIYTSDNGSVKSGRGFRSDGRLENIKFGI